MYINPLVRMKKIHIWIGTFSKSEEEYDNYFNQAKSQCQFCTDIDIEEYDEDFIGIIPLFKEKMSIQSLLNEVPIDKEDIPKALKTCENMNIKDGNAIFYLTDSLISIKNTEKSYNELFYIGMYNSSL